MTKFELDMVQLAHQGISPHLHRGFLKRSGACELSKYRFKKYQSDKNRLERPEAAAQQQEAKIKGQAKAENN